MPFIPAIGSADAFFEDADLDGAFFDGDFIPAPVVECFYATSKLHIRGGPIQVLWTVARTGSSWVACSSTPPSSMTDVPRAVPTG